MLLCLNQAVTFFFKTQKFHEIEKEQRGEERKRSEEEKQKIKLIEWGFFDEIPRLQVIIQLFAKGTFWTRCMWCVMSSSMYLCMNVVKVFVCMNVGVVYV